MNNNSTHKGKENFISKISNALNILLTVTTVLITVVIVVLACNSQVLNRFTGFITIIAASVILTVKQSEQAIPHNFKLYLQSFSLNNYKNIGTIATVQNQKSILNQFLNN
ncbi:MAG: hypothetical protein ABI685_01275 [Ferruginibacter sp.]